jgi:hypothetical protein
MAEAVEPTGSDTAEKAYAAAAELAISQADATKSEPDTELQFPAKTKRIILPAASEAAVATALPEIVVPAELEADLMMKARPTAKQAPPKRSGRLKPPSQHRLPQRSRPSAKSRQ